VFAYGTIQTIKSIQTLLEADMDLRERIELGGTNYLTLTSYHLNSGNLDKHFYAHLHHELEISYIKSGSADYLVEGKIYNLHPGDIIIFNNIESHAINSIGPGQEFVVMVIEFDPRFIWAIESNLFDSRYLAIFFDRNEFFENQLESNNPATIEIARLFNEIEDEFIRKPAEYSLMIKVKLLNILVALIRHYGITRRDNTNYSKRKDDLMIINKVIEYIQDHLSDNLRLEELARIAHMNPSYFSTFFKKYLGMSPSQYILTKRANRAVDYLKTSNKTILEISGLCGFNNIANFNKIFKKKVGKVPSDFR
jgi:AraC-like DNA-binding protein